MSPVDGSERGNKQSDKYQTKQKISKSAFDLRLGYRSINKCWIDMSHRTRYCADDQMLTAPFETKAKNDDSRYFLATSWDILQWHSKCTANLMVPQHV